LTWIRFYIPQKYRFKKDYNLAYEKFSEKDSEQISRSAFINSEKSKIKISIFFYRKTINNYIFAIIKMNNHENHR